MKKSFREVLESVSSANPDLDSKIIDFVLTSLNFANQSHIYHLLTKSYAEHVAIGDFYDCLRGLADGLAEKSIGMGLTQLSASSTVSITFTYNKSTLIQKLGIYRGYVVNMLENTSSNELLSLNDDIIDIQKTIDTLLYKLQLN